jgi:hypothetical protein
MIERREGHRLLPGGAYVLELDDVILLCGTKNSEEILTATANNPYTLHYCITGEDRPKGYVFSWLSGLLVHA